MATMLTIGDFSRMTHLSVKALRHYHDMGVLEPAAVDPFTGYRSYDTSQVGSAQVIRRLRDLGMPLDSIAAMTAETSAEYAAWQDHVGESALYCTDLGDAVAVTDERWGWPRATWRLEGAEAALHRLHQEAGEARRRPCCRDAGQHRAPGGPHADRKAHV